MFKFYLKFVECFLIVSYNTVVHSLRELPSGSQSVTSVPGTKLLEKMQNVVESVNARRARHEERQIREKQQDFAKLIETELINMIAGQPSALMDKPYIEQSGKNDFLVLKNGIQDAHVTVIPNDIYYNYEKSCVNWLDDCSLQGIRNKLLKRYKSPFR